LVIECVGVIEESFSIVFLFFRRLFRMLTLPLMETGAIESLILLVGMLAAAVVVVVLVLVVVVVVGTDLAI
jgi:type IV secretory pathway TrbD component